VKDPEARLARVRTLRAIQPGEELYAEYGEGYWRRRCRLELEEGSRPVKEPPPTQRSLRRSVS
jgi:hypothetical protein